MSASVISDWKSNLGESPRWDPYKKEIITVDITAGIFRSCSLNFNRLAIEFELQLSGFVALVEPLSELEFLLCRQSYIEWRNWSGEIQAEVELPIGKNERMNDGTIDPKGRLIIGTMDIDGAHGAGKLWQIEQKKKPILLRENIGIPNGLIWDSPNSRVYWIDSLAGDINVFYSEFGEVNWNQPMNIWKISDDNSVPDGLCCDRKGNIWVAMWGGSRIDCISQSGDLLARVNLPVSQPTSCVFGELAKNQLFITTARYGLSESALDDQPDAGRMFLADLN